MCQSSSQAEHEAAVAPAVRQRRRRRRSSVTHWDLLSEHPNYRWFLASYFVTHCGEWLTYVASMSLLEQHASASNNGNDQSHQQHHYLRISFLVVARLLPHTLFSVPGGLLADAGWDRRRVMVAIDLLGAAVALGYCLAAAAMVPPLANPKRAAAVLYACTAVQEGLSGLYEPNRSAILPQLLRVRSSSSSNSADESGTRKTGSTDGTTTEDTDDTTAAADKSENSLDDSELLRRRISKANAATAILWSLTAAAGSSLGGFLTQRCGAIACFGADAALYVASAGILAVLVRGDYSVVRRVPNGDGDDTVVVDDDISGKQEEQARAANEASPSSTRNGNHRLENASPRTMLRQMLLYLLTSGTGAYVLIKGCGALLFGASDVVYTTFAETSATTDMEDDGTADIGGDADVTTTTTLDSQRLGWMFAAVGAGCLLGPLLLPEERSHLNSCIGAYAVLGLGYGLIAASPAYWQKCAFTVVRAAGTAVLWVESSILIQTATPLSMLGRVSALDLALALSGESVSAVLAGLLEDGGWDADQVAYLLSGGGLMLSLLWALWSKFFRRLPPSKARKLLAKDSERFDADNADDAELEMEPLHK